LVWTSFLAENAVATLRVLRVGCGIAANIPGNSLLNPDKPEPKRI